MAERLAVNQMVVGSIPTWGANKKKWRIIMIPKYHIHVTGESVENLLHMDCIMYKVAMLIDGRFYLVRQLYHNLELSDRETPLTRDEMYDNAVKKGMSQHTAQRLGEV